MTRRPHDARRLTSYLQHIVDAIARIRDYTAAMSFDAFLDSPITQDATIRNLEIIGEACRNILRHYPEFADRYRQVPWRSPYEMRNALAHGYFDVDLTTTWNTIRVDLPEFDALIRALPWPDDYP